MSKIRIGIADDHKLFRKGVIELLASDPGLEVVLEANSGTNLIEQMPTSKPDLVLMDLKMPGMDGMEATKFFKAHYPEVKIIVLSMIDDDKFILHLIKLGANGYLPKNTDPLELLNAIHTTATKGYYFNERISKVMMEGLHGPKQDAPSLNDNVQFSEREREVLQLLCDGLTTAEIAEKVFLSPRTVEGYRHRMIEKTDTRNTAGLVAYAIRKGLVQ